MKLFHKYRTRRLNRKLVNLIDRQNRLRLNAAEVSQVLIEAYNCYGKRIERVKAKLNKLER